MFYPNIYHHITIVSYVKYGNMGNIIWECMGYMVKYVTIYHIMVRPFLAADLRRSSMPLAPRVGPTWSRRPTKMDITWKSREFGLREMRYNIYICIFWLIWVLFDIICYSGHMSTQKLGTSTEDASGSGEQGAVPVSSGVRPKSFTRRWWPLA